MMGREAIIGMMDGPRHRRNASLTKDLCSSHHLFLILLSQQPSPSASPHLIHHPAFSFTKGEERERAPVTRDFKKLTGLCENAIRKRLLIAFGSTVFSKFLNKVNHELSDIFHVAIFFFL